jgi:hypothetical protein
MNKIPKFFHKSKTQTEEAITSPKKDILTPVELVKLTNKVKVELASAELRNPTTRSRNFKPRNKI